MEDIFGYKNVNDAKPIVRQTSFSPTKILYREEKILSMLNIANTLLVDKKADHLFIYGESGTGKTTSIQYAISKLRNSTGLIPVYISCHEHVTKTAIFNKIADELGNSFSTKGFAAYELFGRIKEILEKDNRSVFLVLDDFEALLKNDGPDILYQIINANEARKNSFALITVSNDLASFEQLDAKIKSSLMFSIIEFERYNKEQIKQMLDVVAGSTLSEDTYDNNSLDKIAEIGASAQGNARFAVGLLLESARNAENRNSRRIELIDIQDVCEKLFLASDIGKADNTPELSVEESFIMEILKMGEMSSSQIYDFFLKKMDRSKRQIRNYLASLVSKEYIDFDILYDENYPLKPRVFRLKKK